MLKNRHSTRLLHFFVVDLGNLVPDTNSKEDLFYGLIVSLSVRLFTNRHVLNMCEEIQEDKELTPKGKNKILQKCIFFNWNKTRNRKHTPKSQSLNARRFWTHQMKQTSFQVYHAMASRKSCHWSLSEHQRHVNIDHRINQARPIKCGLRVNSGHPCIHSFKQRSKHRTNVHVGKRVHEIEPLASGKDLSRSFLKATSTCCEWAKDLKTTVPSHSLRSPRWLISLSMPLNNRSPNFPRL